MPMSNDDWKTLWNFNMDEAPSNKRIIVLDHNMLDTWGTYDSAWGGGRGAWFNDRNQIIADVRCWCTNTEGYLAERPTGSYVKSIK